MADISKLHTKARIRIPGDPFNPSPKIAKQLIGNTLYNPGDVTAQPYDVAVSMIEKGRAQFVDALFVKKWALGKLETDVDADGKPLPGGKTRPCSKKEDVVRVEDFHTYRAIIARMREDVADDRGGIRVDANKQPIRRGFEEAFELAKKDVKIARS